MTVLFVPENSSPPSLKSLGGRKVEIIDVLIFVTVAWFHICARAARSSLTP
jgi:hypothetical protein